MRSGDPHGPRGAGRARAFWMGKARSAILWFNLLFFAALGRRPALRSGGTYPLLWAVAASGPG